MIKILHIWIFEQIDFFTIINFEDAIMKKGTTLVNTGYKDWCKKIMDILFPVAIVVHKNRY